MTTRQLAQIAYDNLETRTRDDGATFITRTDTAPAWLQDVCMTAHGDMFPDDHKYEFIRDAVAIIAEDYDPVESSDSDVDGYTGQLLAWLSSNLNRMSYVDEAVEQYGYKDLSTAMMQGQYRERREVYDLVLSALEDLETDDEEAEEETANA